MDLLPSAGLLPELRAIVGENGVLTGERLASRVYDKHVGTVAARVLVRPSSTEQVSAVLRLCHSRGQPVVPHGGLTGLVYGCSARENELLLSLEALNQIESVDVAGRTMRDDMNRSEFADIGERIGHLPHGVADRVEDDRAHLAAERAQQGGEIGYTGIDKRDLLCCRRVFVHQDA